LKIDFSQTNEFNTANELVARRTAVDAAFQVVPDNFNITTVAVDTGEADYSDNAGLVMSKSELLTALNQNRRLVDQGQIICEHIIKYDFRCHVDIIEKALSFRSIDVPYWLAKV
jgi:hypothetical protein